MNWKIVVGIAIGIALIAMGLTVAHGTLKKVANTNLLDDNPPGDGSGQGPHPPGDTAWQTIEPTIEGPHPPGDTAWG